MSREPSPFRHRYLRLRLLLLPLRRCPDMRGADELTEEETQALLLSINDAVREHRRSHCFRKRWEAEREKA